TMETDILPVDPLQLGHITTTQSENDLVEEWTIAYDPSSPATQNLQRAAHELLTTDVPVAFPTETVYGLGADATRSSAVRAIFAAKGRPADNPLIVHVHSLAQLRGLLRGSDSSTTSTANDNEDPIPAIYKPLIQKFWPGPLTLILPLPTPSPLAPEVTATLSTFGARMPRSILALSLIRLAGVPLAAPSANASTRPSPTAAEHVYDDLHGRISTILDGGPCEVGVESTVVDGLCDPPLILRPGGITVEQLRTCEGWENVGVGYLDKEVEGKGVPRAPGMKYRHYSPKARVVLFEANAGLESEEVVKRMQGCTCVGVIRTRSWPLALGLVDVEGKAVEQKLSEEPSPASMNGHASATTSNLQRSLLQHKIPHAEQFITKSESGTDVTIWDIGLGVDTEDVARGLFSALRELDKKGVEVILVEGVNDQDGDDIAAAVMNRLRKAAEVR
ncbi:translation factor, partial [Sporormia fimetaria CBS 119925]